MEAEDVVFQSEMHTSLIMLKLFFQVKQLHNFTLIQNCWKNLHCVCHQAVRLISSSSALHQKIEALKLTIITMQKMANLLIDGIVFLFSS